MVTGGDEDGGAASGSDGLDVPVVPSRGKDHHGVRLGAAKTTEAMASRGVYSGGADSPT